MVPAIDLNFSIQIASILVLIVGSLFLYNKKIYSYWKNRGIPGPDPVFIFGNSLQLASKSLVEFDQDLVSKYGNLVGIYNMTQPILLACDADVVQEVTIKKFHSFVNRRDFNNGNTMLSCMLTGASDAYWKRMRKLMSPAFSTGKIRAMSQLMKKPLERYLTKLDARQEVNLKETMYRVTLNVIVRTSFGVELAEGPENEFAVAQAVKALKIRPIKMLLAISLPLFMKKLFNFSIFEHEPIEYFVKMADAMIDQRKANPDQTNEFTDFVALMLDAEDVESKDKLTRLEITANCLMVILAGFETTSMTLITLFFNLAHNQNVQDKLRAELKDLTIEDANDLEGNSSSLTYLDAVLKESLRIGPPATKTERIASENVTLSNGLKIDAGTLVAFPIYALHHSKKYWANPEKFDPERFLPENKDKINPYAFMPFHSGPRNCIGERFALIEVKLTVIKVIQKFKLLPSPKTSYPLTYPNSAVLLSVDDVFVTFERL